MTLRLLSSARADIRAIADYIARDSPNAAERWSETVISKCERIGKTPGMGTARSDVDPALRALPVGKYLIFYRLSGPDVEIVRVLHGARDWQALL